MRSTIILPDGLLLQGLARGEYRLMPLWIWIYSIFWWFVQDAFKVGVCSY
jgi:hypothetical protein